MIKSNLLQFSTAIPSENISVFSIENFDYRGSDDEVKTSDFLVDWTLLPIVKYDGVHGFEVQVKRIYGKVTATLLCHTDDDTEYDDEATDFRRDQEIEIDSALGKWKVESGIDVDRYGCIPKEMTIHFSDNSITIQ